MTFLIENLATALPQQSVEQAFAAEGAKNFLWGESRTAEALPALFRRARVRRRGSVVLDPPENGAARQSFYWPSSGPDDRGPSTAQRMERFAREAVPLARAAASAALENRAAAEITHLVTVSCTGFFAPGIDIALVRELGLRPTVGRLHVGFMGCHGAINGLRACQALVEADPWAAVLLVAVELCSLHFQYGNDPEHLVANSLFADGAAALVGRNGGGGKGPWRLRATGSCILPDADGGMSWRIGDHGFTMTLSPRVPELIARHLRNWFEPWLASHGYKLADIRSWAIHPGGPRILSSVVEALALPPDAAETSAEILAEHGNMSSPTVLFVLDRLRRKGAAGPCVAMAFGPGLVAEAALFE